VPTAPLLHRRGHDGREGEKRGSPLHTLLTCVRCARSVLCTQNTCTHAHMRWRGAAVPTAPSLRPEVQRVGKKRGVPVVYFDRHTTSQATECALHPRPTAKWREALGAIFSRNRKFWNRNLPKNSVPPPIGQILRCTSSLGTKISLAKEKNLVCPPWATTLLGVLLS